MIAFLGEIIVNKQCFLFATFLTYQFGFPISAPMPLDFINMWFAETLDFASILTPSVEFVDYPVG